MKKKTALVVILILILFILLFRKFTLRKTVEINKIAQNEFDLDSNTYSKRVPPEYVKLLSNNGQFAIDRTDESKRRNPISEYFYKGKFYLQIYKIDTLGDLSIDKIIKEKFESTKASFNTDYIQFENNTPFVISYKLENKPKNISEVYFTLFGSDTKVLRKDQNMAYYYSKFENFSIRYHQVGQKDIYGNMKDNFQGKHISCEIMFLKENKNLFYILLSALDDKTNLDMNMLYNLVRSNR